MQKVPSAEFRKLCTKIFIDMKVPTVKAETASNIIIENSLYSHDSHGACLIPRFVEERQKHEVTGDYILWEQVQELSVIRKI